MRLVYHVCFYEYSIEERRMTMKKPFRRFWPKQRQYPVQYDEEGKSIRQICFEEFDRGKRPVQVSREHGFNLNSVYTYHRDWKRLPRGWHQQRERVQLIRKVAPDFLIKAATIIGRKLGMPPDEVINEIYRPYGFLSMISGKWPRHNIDPATQEAVTILADLLSTVFVGRILCNHPRAILHDLEMDGIDFTKKRSSLRNRTFQEKLDNTKKMKTR